jgi:hypothetical protein
VTRFPIEHIKSVNPLIPLLRRSCDRHRLNGWTLSALTDIVTVLNHSPNPNSKFISHIKVPFSLLILFFISEFEQQGVSDFISGSTECREKSGALQRFLSTCIVYEYLLVVPLRKQLNQCYPLQATKVLMCIRFLIQLILSSNYNTD